MHILITANATWNVWNFRRSLVKALVADGHRVTIAAPPDESIPQLTALGCRWLPLTMNVQGLNPIDDMRLIGRFRHIFRTEQPNLVLGYTIKNNVFGAIAACSCGLPFIPNVTGLGTAFLSGGILQAIAERLYRRAFAPLSVIFFQNEDDRDLFLKRRLARPDQARILPGSGVDLARFAKVDMPHPDSSPVFLMIARLLRDKGVLEFVAAAKQYSAMTRPPRFQLLGATDSENRTAIDARTVREWVDEGILEYLGVTSDVRPYIAAAHCVVLPSYREGAPRTLIEAAAMGRPIITSDVPGCRNIVEPGVSGFLCKARDADSLSTAMKAYLDLPYEEKMRMGEAGRIKMEREFDEAIVVQAYRDAIDDSMP